MHNTIQDARLRELALLTRLERETSITVTSEDVQKDPTLKSMVVYLLHEGLVNALDTVPAQVGEATEPHLNFGGKSYLQIKF